MKICIRARFQSAHLGQKVISAVLVAGPIPLFMLALQSFAQVPAMPQPFQFENQAAKEYLRTVPPPQQGTTNAIPRYSPIPGGNWVYNPSLMHVQKYLTSPEEDISQYNRERERKQHLIDEANAVFNEAHIDYELPFIDLPEKRSYALAFQELHKMLSGEKPLNLETAVFMAEGTYDPTLKFADFDDQLNKSAAVIGLKMEQDKLSPTDNLGKVMTVFRFMADTIAVSTKQESKIITYPKTYDFTDFWGRQDYRKMFVSKLLREGTGQCHSLPLYFLLLCEKIGAEANLAFAPNHSYIKFKDKRGKWHNIELTNGMLASDHFIVESGFIKAEAMQNKIYMEPLTKKQVIVQCLNDLALGYEKKYGYDPFVKLCSEEALRYDPKSLTALQILANYYMTRSNYIVYQYQLKNLGKSKFDADRQATSVIAATKDALKAVQDLGYSDMPPEAYAAWLSSMQKEACKRQHTNEVKVLGGMIELKK